MRSTNQPTTIDAYLAPLTAEMREALEKLRRDIHAAAAGLVECISYGVPAVRLDGRMLVAFGAAAKHAAFYPGARPIAEHAAALKGYSTSTGTVRFAPGEPLPAALVRKLVRTRVAEYAERWPEKAERKAKDGAKQGRS